MNIDIYRFIMACPLAAVLVTSLASMACVPGVAADAHSHMGTPADAGAPWDRVGYS